MTENSFKNTFIANYTSSVVAQQKNNPWFELYLSNVITKEIVKEAIFLADAAWKKYLEETE